MFCIKINWKRYCLLESKLFKNKNRKIFCKNVSFQHKILDYHRHEVFWGLKRKKNVWLDKQISHIHKNKCSNIVEQLCVGFLAMFIKNVIGRKYFKDSEKYQWKTIIIASNFIVGDDYERQINFERVTSYKHLMNMGVIDMQFFCFYIAFFFHFQN